MSLKQLAKTARRTPTKEERDLWRVLRGRRFAGFKFRRQHVIDSHIADFYCADAKLAIELDGFMHGSPDEIKRDKEREQHFADRGIQTLRFWNHQWRKNRDGCLLEIWNTLQKRTGCVEIATNKEKRFIAPKLIDLTEKDIPSPLPSPRLAGRGSLIQ